LGAREILLNRFRNYLANHGRFYTAALIGALVFALAYPLAPPVRFLAAGDSFFAIFLAAIAVMIARVTPDDLRARAAVEDEGIFIVVFVALAVIAFSSVSIITVLHQKSGSAPLSLALALLAMPLGWFALHTLVAFHYAYLFYGRKGSDSEGGLCFAQTPEPGVWEFLYYAFTIGMTAQTSDTNVHSTRMRRATLAHSVVSFFYNTAIIAMSVNAIIAIAS
jgi:uncharacterized membrane protein